MACFSKWFYLSVIMLICQTIQCAVVSSPDTGNEAVNSRTARKEDGSARWKVAGKFVGQCIEMADPTAVAECFAVKTIAILDRAARMNNINIVPGISFVVNEDLSADEQQQRHSRALLSEQDIENKLTSEPADKSSRMIDMLVDSVSRFLQTHSLQLRVPKSADFDLERAFDEGRAKLKKKLLPFVGLLALKIFALLPLLLGTVGFLALKALVIGKIALVIAAILALQKYSSSGSSGLGFGKLTDSFGVPSNVAGWSSSASSNPGGYYRRSIDGEAAHQLAYNAQIPAAQSPSAESTS